jgi:hypothetical protein
VIQLHGSVIEIDGVYQLRIRFTGHSFLEEHWKVLQDDVLDTRDVLSMHPVFSRRANEILFVHVGSESKRQFNRVIKATIEYNIIKYSTVPVWCKVLWQL